MSEEYTEVDNYINISNKKISSKKNIIDDSKFKPGYSSTAVKDTPRKDKFKHDVIILLQGPKCTGGGDQVREGGTG